MNIHPIFVHFPIAFFTIYCIAELIRFSFVTRQSFWFYIKACLVIVGSVAGLFFTIPTGVIARIMNVVGRSDQNIIAHETFAITTVVFFTVIAVCYIVLWFEKFSVRPFTKWKSLDSMWSTLQKIAHSVLDTRIILILAIIGLVLVMITGSLGGALVYGNHNDPAVTFLTSLFFK
jgi:uncharacterized membrane protein